MDVHISIEDPAQHDDVVALLEVHLSTMHAQSPACSVHALDLDGLRIDEITFFVLRNSSRVLLGVGAIKRLSKTEAELKSMHVALPHRGSGAAQILLDHMLSYAAKAGFRSVSLETGSQPEFEPARRFYARNGFRFCAPFGSYSEDPNSVFMSRAGLMNAP